METGLVHGIPANIWGTPSFSYRDSNVTFLPFGRSEGDLSASKDQEGPESQLCFSGPLVLKADFH